MRASGSPSGFLSLCLVDSGGCEPVIEPDCGVEGSDPSSTRSRLVIDWRNLERFVSILSRWLSFRRSSSVSASEGEGDQRCIYAPLPLHERRLTDPQELVATA